jgi:hypothetical protein
MIILAIKNWIDKRKCRIFRRMNVERVLRMIDRSGEERNRRRRRTVVKHHGESESEASGSRYHNKGINFHGRGSENTEKWRAKKKKKIVLDEKMILLQYS